jgi:hypothetical protein
VVGPAYQNRVERWSRVAPKEYTRGCSRKNRAMKHLIPILLTAATITVGITTALAQAHSALIGGAWLKPPYVYGYAIASILVLIAVATAIKTGRHENQAAADNKHKQHKDRFAALMRQWREIYASMSSASNDSEYTEIIRTASDWTNSVMDLCNEAGHPTDAELISHVGHVELSGDQLANFAHIPEWKRNDVARFLLYYQTLDQIRSNRRF